MRIAIFVMNTYVNDSRVIKQAESLATRYLVDVFCLNDGRFPTQENPSQNVRLLRNVSYSQHATPIVKKLRQGLAYLKYITSSLSALRKYDVAHCNDLETLPIGVAGKLLNRKLKVVYDAHEYETETLWMQNPLKKFLARALEKSLIGFADDVCVVSNGIADEYVRLYGIAKPKLVLNTPKLSSMQKTNLFREKFNIPNNATLFLYQGGLTNGRGIEILLESFARLNSSDSVIVFMGYGPLEGKIRQFVKGYANIYFHEAVSPDALLPYTGSADFGISFTEDSCLNHTFCLPNKFFEYIMAGVPVICSNLVEMRQMISIHRCGLVADTNDAEGFLDCIKRASTTDNEELVLNAMRARQSLNWEAQEKVLFKMYQGL
ncbi:glycosyltransferase family 4 protein [Congregibacter brevis]|uniref:Glycosyltransferase family 4 protein n=1 Tax=Congregibacter brevis TaxID=3081201 RepID=A0ABZ0IBY8_9GAMM|nr:glycosyltransferase family 4 protein [Congregibacter sp. IMCC45268]